jgi:organic radical activating enzyme
MTDQLHCPMSYAVYKFQPEIGEFSACCDAVVYKFNKDWFEELGPDYFEKFPTLIDRKNALYNDERHIDCKQCWEKEDIGLRSMRQIFGPRYTSLHNNRNLLADKAYVSRVELWMNSTCNLGCFMCNLGNSNTLRKIWSDTSDLNGNDGNGYGSWINQNNYQTDYREMFTKHVIDFTVNTLKNAEHGMNIAYLGGEPTLHDEMYDHADIFIEAAKENIQLGKQFVIEIVTNGTSKPKLNERFMGMFQKYKEAGWDTAIMISQDSADKYVDVRHGADFNAIKNNFSSWISANSIIGQIKSHTVISNLNLPYMDNMARYLHETILNNYIGDRELEINFNTLTHPKWMHLKYLPRKYAETQILSAKDILTTIKSEFGIRINTEVFDEILRVLPEQISQEDAEMIFSKYKYVAAQYKKVYNGWDFFETFEHLQPFAEEYGIDI